MENKRHQIQRRDALKLALGIAGGLSTFSVLGCSKILLSSGKILFGDPKVQSEFTKLTKEDLTRGTKTAMVVCSSPESVDEDITTVKHDIVDGVSRRLKIKGVKTIEPKRVAEWIDEHDGIIPDTQEIANDFDTDYIIWINVLSFHLHEPNSNKLLRGHTSGYIHVSKVTEQGDARMAMKHYQTEFALTYPEHQAISSEGRSVVVFSRDYMNHLCDLLAERFYDHRVGSQI